jgi:peptidyl-prolyl cis-trans isomerase A (cyclophilin A)
MGHLRGGVRRASCAVRTAILWVAMAIALPASQETGQLFGVVKDAGGRVLAGVTVTITSSASPQPRTATTDADGAYRVSQLPPGTYRAAFTASGFFPFTQDSIVIRPGAPVGLNATLASAAVDRQQLQSLFKSGEVGVELETPLGTILIAVDSAHAPITAANFLKYVDGHFYDGGRFHRATRPDNYTPAPPNRPAMEIIQAGINPARNAERFPAIPLERTSVTGLKHVAGVVSMARATAADTATSDFFILLDDQPSLDFGGKRFDDGQGAAAFGRVVQGMEVVRKIQQQPVDGQNLTPPVPITRAARFK